MRNQLSSCLDYLDWRGDLSFEVSPFNEVDALILSQIIYLDFSGVIPEYPKNSVSFSEAVNRFKALNDYEDRKIVPGFTDDRTCELFEKCGNTERFKNVLLSGYKCVFNEEIEEQYASAFFSLDKKTHCLVFRGTDDSFLGWKEDGNISFMQQIASHKTALDIFSLAQKYYSGQFILCGHSKGGNVALNTALYCTDKARKRIAGIYDFDGPGFKKEVYEKAAFKSIENKLHAYYPQFSIVGMIFEHPANYEIVHSSGFAIGQHDLISWQVKGNQLVNDKAFTDESNLFYVSFNEWASTLSEEERKNFIQSFFDILYSSGAKSNTELEKNLIPASAKMLAAFSKLEKDKREYMLHVIHVLIHVFKNNLPALNVFGKRNPVKTVRKNKIAKI